MLPSTLQRLVQMFARLPSVGDKTAQRFALALASGDMETTVALGRALADVAARVTRCTRCNGLAERPEEQEEGTEAGITCAICSDTRRDGATLCVVARVQDMLSIERSAAYRGYYFVLGRLLSPLEGVDAAELPLDQLAKRVEEDVAEVLVATPPSVDGEATALLIARELAGGSLKVTRLASGVPHGGDLEFADPVTIGRAIAGRRGLD